ncbi:MAG: GumC family protein [Phycisphaeraceae bacterium]
MATNKQEQAKAIYELWDVILQHRWRFVLPAFAVTAIVLFVSLFLPRKYEAVAYFERRNAPELIEAIRGGASDSYIDPLQAVTKEISGSNAISQVINDLDPKLREIGYITNDTDLRTLRQSVTQQLLVSREYSDTTRMNLRLQLVLDDPHISALIVNELVDRYMENTRDALMERANSSIAYFDKLIEEHRAELERKQKTLGLFEQEHAMLLPEQPFSVQTQLGEAQEQLSMLTTDLEGLEIQRRSLQEVLQSEPKTVPSTVRSKNPDLIRLENKLEKLKDTIRDYTTTRRMTETHPEVIALRQQEIELRAQVENTQSNVITSTEEHPNPKRAELELALTSANGERNAIKEQISLRRKKINELSLMSADMLPVRAEYRKLLSLVNTSQQDVDYYQDMRRRAKNYLTPETGERGVQMEFIRRAEPVTIPISPNLMQVIIVAGFLGIASGALSVFIAYRTDDSYRNARQVAETTTIPVLGSVSELITRQHQRMRRIRYSIFYPANAVLMACVLVGFGSLLYLDLQRPDMLEKLKDQAKDALVINSTEKASDPTPEVGLRVQHKPQG